MCASKSYSKRKRPSYSKKKKAISRSSFTPLMAFGTLGSGRPSGGAGNRDQDANNNSYGNSAGSGELGPGFESAKHRRNSSLAYKFGKCKRG
jgi:hypothetical protein